MPKRLVAGGVAVIIALILIIAQLGGPTSQSPAPAADGSAATAAPVDRGAGYLPYEDAQPVQAVSLWDAFARMVFALAFVLGLLGLSLIALKRFFPTTAPAANDSAVRVLGRVPLDQKHGVYFLQLPGKLLLIGTGGGTTSTLSEITDPQEIAEITRSVSGASVTTPFGGLLQRRIQQAHTNVTNAAAGPEDAPLDSLRRHIVGLREIAKTEPRQ